MLWFLGLYMLTGYTMLALTIVNLGSIFRYRIPFFLVCMVLGSIGLADVWGRVRAGAPAGDRAVDPFIPPEVAR